MQVASLVELREALRTAAPGDTIDLAPGEYQGPILIDVPVTLRGRNRETVLWRRGGPVIYVRTSGVKLDKLLIERTVQSDGPLVVHQADCTPSGRESRLVDALISLGELVAGSTVTLPLEIETTARAEISVAGLYGAHISPNVIDDAGKHLVWLTLDGSAVARGEVILGELTVREGGDTRYIWLSGSVLDAAPTDHPLCLATKKSKLYPSARGLLLGDAQLTALDNAVHAPGNYAYIQHDITGALSLYLPADPPVPVTLNNHAIARWNRVLLHEKDTIKVDGVTLTVQPAEPPLVRVEPAVVVLDFDEQFPDPVIVKVHNGKTAWKGRVLPVARWLTVSPEGDFRLPASRTIEWQVQLNSDALALTDGAHEVVGGLLVAGQNQLIGVDVRINVRRPEVSLQVAPVDAGSVEWGWPNERQFDVVVGNLGRGTWTGTVRSAVSWLEVVTPMPLTCDAWSEAIAQVQIVPDWNTLAIGTYDLPAALVVESADGDQPVAVRLQVTPPRSHIVALAEMVAFDQIEHNAPTPTVTLQIRNDGGAPWTGTLSSVGNWVKIRPSAFTDENAIAPGAIADIEIHLAEVPPEAALDTPETIDTIQIEDGVSSVAIPVQITLVELPPFLVANPVSFPPFVKGDTLPEGMLRIHNNGPARWRGTVQSNSPLIILHESNFSCEAGSSVDIYLSLNSKALDDLKPGLTELADAITISGGREPVSAIVYIDLREAISELHLETLTLNFGPVDGTSSEPITQNVRLVNASPALASAKIELCAEWLSVQRNVRSFEVEIQGNTIVEFTVALNDAVRQLSPGIISEDRALVITGREQQMIVRALLVMNESSPLLTIMPETITLTGDTAQSVRVKNTGKRAWTLQANAAKWLTVTPTEITLEPDQEQSIEIKRAGTETSKLHDLRGVVLIGPGREYDIEVKLAEQSVQSPLTTPPVPTASAQPAEKTEQTGPSS